MKKVLNFHPASSLCATEVTVTNEDYFLLNEYCKIRNEDLNTLIYDIIREYLDNHAKEFKEIKRNEYMRIISEHEGAIKRVKAKIEELEQKRETEV